MKRTWIALSTCLLITNAFAKSGMVGPKLVLISLDGLKKTDIDNYAKELQNPHPFGIRYLLQKGHWKNSLEVTNPSITASSHISTITCTTPGVHGVISNSQWNGQNMVSGFNFHYRSESFPAALRKQGIKVAAVGYPGIDPETPERMATENVSYDSPAGKAQFLKVNHGSATAFHILSHVHDAITYSATASVDTAGRTLTVTLSSGEKFSAARGEWLHVFVNDTGVKQEADLNFFEDNDGVASVYVSPTSKNVAFPESLRSALDKQNLIFSAAKQYGLPEALMTSALLQRTRYFTAVGRYVAQHEAPQVMLFYLEDLDTLGHQFEGDESKTPLRIAHFQQFDHLLGDFIASLPPDTNIAVMGDHGMSAIQYDLNLRALIDADAVSNTYLNSSGGAAFIYGKGASLTSEPPVNEAWFQKMVSDLKSASVEFDNDKPVFQRVVVKGSDEAKSMGLAGSDMPWIMAFATDGIGIQTSVESKLLLSLRQGFRIPEGLKNKYPEPMNGDRLVQPLFGAHGHYSGQAELKTTLMLMGPEISQIDLNTIHRNIDVVPALADAMRLPRPSGCR